MELKKAIERIVNLKNLSEDEAYRVALKIMSGEATDAQIAAILISLRLKGETIDEITGFVRAMRERAVRVECEGEPVVDTCGTGGDRSGTFNVSTLSAIVAAGAGCYVAKHGNRAVSSMCGSADLLTELGVRVEIAPELIKRCIDENGIGFLYAPALHRAMKHAIGPRREMGVRTLFNLIGPLTNPAGAKHQLIGVFNINLSETLVNVLKRLGSEHIMVVHGEDGLDEITITARTHVCELVDNKIKRYTLAPEDFGLKRASLEEVRGGDSVKNAEIAMAVLLGQGGPCRDLVLMNAGAVIYLSGNADSIKNGIGMAEESIDSGMALKKLEGLKEITNSEK